MIEKRESLPKEVEAVLAKKESFRKRLKDKSKRQVQRLIYGRTLIIIVLLLLQFYIMFSMVYSLQQYSAVYYASMQLTALITIIAIMNRTENPGFKTAWLALIAILPIFGAALYIFVHNQLGTRVIHRRIKERKLEIRYYLPRNHEAYQALQQEDNYLASIARFVDASAGCSVFQHTHATYFPLGEDKFKQLLIDLSQAKKFIFMEYFIIREGIMWDSIEEILVQKVKEGVEVRVLYDGLCTFADVPVTFAKKLREKGIDAREFGPIRPVLSTVQNNRDHRKIAVIDGEIAYTGGVNLADEYINEFQRFGHWKDVAIRITGEAVNTYTVMFLSMWNLDLKESEAFDSYLVESAQFQSIKNDGYIIPYLDCPFDEYYVAKQVYLMMLHRAVNYVHIMTPYLILDNETMEALCSTAMRGVEVILLLPHVPDKKYTFWLGKTYQEQLLGAGVRIFEYTPGFVHAKVATSDDSIAIVGTSNLDYRSFYLHYECGAIFCNHDVIPSIESDIQHTLVKCQEVEYGFYKKEPIHVRLFGRILRLVAPLM